MRSIWNIDHRRLIGKKCIYGIIQQCCTNTTLLLLSYLIFDCLLNHMIASFLILKHQHCFNNAIVFFFFFFVKAKSNNILSTKDESYLKTIEDAYMFPHAVGVLRISDIVSLQFSGMYFDSSGFSSAVFYSCPRTTQVMCSFTLNGRHYDIFVTLKSLSVVTL